MLKLKLQQQQKRKKKEEEEETKTSNSFLIKKAKVTRLLILKISYILMLS